MHPATPVPVSVPRYAAPAGACDCHAHVFGPYARFPLAAQRTYTPPQTVADSYLQMLGTLGFARGVLVQPSAHGLDNGALLHALHAGGAGLRGVAVVDASASEEDLVRLYQGGVRGLRFSRLLDAGGAPRYKNAVDIRELPALLPAMRKAGLHAQLWLGADQLEDLAPLIRSAGIPFVIDHLGRPDASGGTTAPAFRRMLALVEEGHLFVKLTPYRPSRAYPAYEDMRPFHAALVAANPERLLWGSDWPHINLPSQVPDVGHLVDLLAEWTPDRSVLQKILVTNPATLYGF